MAGEFRVSEDFDRLGQDEIVDMFGGRGEPASGHSRFALGGG